MTTEAPSFFVIRRDGTLVPYNKDKIRIALSGAYRDAVVSNGERFFCRQANIEELLETNNWKMEPCNEWADDTGQITLNGRHKMVIDITGRIGGMRVTRIQWSAKHQ